ncbi:MAG TPA: hypothetical protein PJ982_08970, partial [Lacipirellulaceae bacterium]|nr:hypothetical protein [Lacipirellulaceae bacterium]
MTNSPIRKFCESRYRWPIVATATGVFALATVCPAADEYFANRSSRRELSEELAHARQTAAALPKYEKRFAEVDRELTSLEQRTVDDATLSAFRSRLVDLVRESGCQIRQIDVGPPTRRPWKQGDDPLDEAASGSSGAAATGFSLERRSVLLAVDGAMAALHDLLARLEQERSLSHPHRVQMQAAAAGGETVMLEMELWLF